MNGPGVSPTMNEDSELQVPPDDDRTPTQEDEPSPAAKPADEWVMPPPVFRQSEGYDPREQQPAVSPVPQSEIDTDVPDASEDEAAPAPESATANDDPPPAVAAQPDLSGDFTLDEIETVEPASRKRGSGALSIILVVLAIAAGIAVLFVFLAIVYLLFFFPNTESQNLN
jgi:hypothetical protein